MYKDIKGKQFRQWAVNLRQGWHFSGIMVGRDINSTLLASYDWPSFFSASPQSPARGSLLHPWCQSSPGGVKTLELIDSCQTLATSSQQPGRAMKNRLKSGKMSKCTVNVWTCFNKYISGARSPFIETKWSEQLPNCERSRLTLTGVVPSFLHQGRLWVYPQGQCQQS